MNRGNIINTLFKIVDAELKFINSSYYDKKAISSDFKPFITSEIKEIKSDIYSQYFLKDTIDTKKHYKTDTSLSLFYERMLKSLKKTNTNRTFRLIMNNIYTTYIPAIINTESIYIENSLHMRAKRIYVTSTIKIFIADLGDRNISFPVSNVIDIKPYMTGGRDTVSIDTIERTLMATADILSFFRKDEPKKIFFEKETRATHERCGMNFIIRVSPFDVHFGEEYGTIAINAFNGMIYPSTKYFRLKKALERKYREMVSYNYDFVYNHTYDLCTIILNLYRGLYYTKVRESVMKREKRMMKEMIDSLFT